MVDPAPLGCGLLGRTSDFPTLELGPKGKGPLRPHVYQSPPVVPERRSVARPSSSGSGSRTNRRTDGHYRSPRRVGPVLTRNPCPRDGGETNWNLAIRPKHSGPHRQNILHTLRLAIPGTRETDRGGEGGLKNPRDNMI